jgi:chromosome segregation ATPase
MQLPKELLSEANYTGSRLIEITDETVLKLREQLTELQQEANPHLEASEEFTPEMDRIYGEIQELEFQKKKLQEEVAPIRAKYDEAIKPVEEIDQRATLIKNKITPIVNEIIEKELGEFEMASTLTEKDGKIYVEVLDQIEEKVKAIRTQKAKTLGN